MLIEAIVYKTDQGKEPFTDCFYTQDQETKERILSRINRVQLGNLGDHKFVSEGVWELRLNFSSGYRIYFGKIGKKIVLLLCGGDKKSQKQDIKKAQKYWSIYENHKK